MASTAPRPDIRRIGRLAALGMLGAVALVWIDVGARGNGNPVSLLQPGADGPSAEVIQSDFPDLELPRGLGHDGQQFYAIARDPVPLERSAPHLDRPRYRLQRPLLPALAWLLHPTGGGVGLVMAMFVVNALAIAVGVAASALIVSRAGGPPWAGLLFAAMPGVLAALRISTADALAMALALAAVAAIDNRRRWVAPLLGALAALAREPTLLLLVGFAAGRRDRRSMLAALAAAAAAAVWALYVRVAITVDEEQVVEFVAPLSGWRRSVEDWARGDDLIAAASAAVALGIAVVALLRRRRSPWIPAIVLQLVFVVFLGESVIGLDYNGTRTMMPLLAMSGIALLQPLPQREQPGTGNGPRC